MKFSAILMFVIVAFSAIMVNSQLILDEDDPETKVLIDIMMKAINEHEHANYKFKTVVYSLGETTVFKIMLKVTTEQGVSFHYFSNSNSFYYCLTLA